jgi:hypothetical protein
MTKHIRTTEPTLKTIRDKGPTLPRIEPGTVEAALGAEESGGRLEAALAPISLFAVREELVKRLQSSGGRPALTGTSRRAKIPLGDKEWLELEELAAALASPGFAPTAGQVASVLLTLSVRSVASQASSSPKQFPASLLRELAERAANQA